MTFLKTLPFHHRDPFDRLIIAQALVEELPIIGCRHCHQPLRDNQRHGDRVNRKAISFLI